MEALDSLPLTSMRLFASSEPHFHACQVGTFLFALELVWGLMEARPSQCHTQGRCPVSAVPQGPPGPLWL